MPPEKRGRIEYNFAHYGIKILLFVRWLPGIRSPMFITAGMMRVPLWQFVAADTVAAAMGHTLLFFLAFWFGDQFRDLVLHAEQQVDRIRPIIILTVLVTIPLYFLFRYLRRTIPTADPKELPLIGDKVAAGIESLDSKTSFLLHKEQATGVRGQESGVADHSLGNHEHSPQEAREGVHPPSAERGRG
jgi:hypothetical protein